MKALFARLQKKLGDMSPVMEEIGDIGISSIEKNIEAGGRYSSPESWRGGGKKWKPLAPATIKARSKRGTWPGKILQESGELMASISKAVTNDSVRIGSNKVQAAIMQFGGKAGRGRKVTIPARPYLVFQPEDIEEMKHAVEDYLVGK
ncbi:MAG TPA: phage virion morphogenesis protein [Nitrospirae bacterium]|nr:phage virion morphogenesis protein [Nitrospirota bacterium]HDK81019.1 phage virion morphogenesis protein [Nitrospirota bacterium]